MRGSLAQGKLRSPGAKLAWRLPSEIIGNLSNGVSVKLSAVAPPREEDGRSSSSRSYERVESTTATPFALSAVQRALPGVLITWARQHSDAPVQNEAAYADAVEAAYQLLRERYQTVQSPEDQARSLQEMERVREELEYEWGLNPQEWEKFPPTVYGEYLMLWPGQFATLPQKQRGFVVPRFKKCSGSNARQVFAPPPHV